MDVAGTPRVPFSRLAKVELRKMLDTRSGFWLLLVTGILLALVAGLVLLVVALNDEVGPTAYDWSQIMVIPLSLLLPVFAILTVTSEWSQRSGLVTFSLEPNRLRVLAAKLAAVVALALAIVVLATVLGALGNVVGAAMGGYDAEWNFGPRLLLTSVVVQVLYFLMAFGLGTVILNTPGAVAIFYVVALILPLIVYGILYSIFDWARQTIPWIDLQYGTAPFFDQDLDLSGVDVARGIVVVLLWIVLPLVVGARRVSTSEPK
jgi:hypothetical protein